MPSQDLIREARKAWFEYGKAVKLAFNFRSGSLIVSEQLEAMLSKASDDAVNRFIKYAREQTEEMKTMKWMGEPD